MDSMTLAVDMDQRFHVSSVVGAALANSSIPWRLQRGNESIASVTNGLRPRASMKFGRLLSSFPLERSVVKVWDAFSDEEEQQDGQAPPSFYSTKLLADLTGSV